MDIERYYKVYDASQYDSLDVSLFHSNPKWNVAETQFLVEFKEKPHGNTITLNTEEAKELVRTPEWTDYSDLEATF